MNTNKTGFELILIFIMLIVLLVFGIFMSVNEVTDPFLYYDIAFLKEAQIKEEIKFPESGPFASLHLASGRIVFMNYLANMMGVDFEALQFFPVGIIFVACALYLLCRQLLNSTFAALVMPTYLILNLSHATSLWSIFAYALATPVFLCFLYFSLQFFQKRDYRVFFVLLLLFVALNFIHYTLTAWVVLFLFGANITIWLQRRQGSSSKKSKLIPVYYLSIAFLNFFLQFNETLYESYIPLIAPETLDSAVQRFFSYIFLGPDPYGSSPYDFIRANEINFVSTGTLLFILVPVFFGIMHDSWGLIKKRTESLQISSILPIIFGIFVFGVIDAVVYSFRGSISTKTFSMFFPILTLIYIKRFGGRFLYSIGAVFLIFSSILKFGVFYNNKYVVAETGVNYSRVSSSTVWIEEHINKDNYKILVDMNLYGKYLVSSISGPTVPLFQSYTLELYENSIGISDNDWINPPDIIALDLSSSQPVIGFV